MAENKVATMMEDLPASLNFSEEEVKVLEYWESIKAFEEQLRLSEKKPEYTFYDGPPFATGLPHYGHILAGTIKDTVTRYATQTGHYVQRRAGWDCHGLPVEFEIDKLLNITSRDQVVGPEGMGIAEYNRQCRGIVTRYTKEWETTVKRLGRWIDFENDYKTMSPWFMESVWWVFKQLFDKGLVYQGYKVMPYSTACGTPLANFEAGLNYKDVEDPAVTVSFPVCDEAKFGKGAAFLAWTTTPWTLPSNLALCVNEDFDYVKLQDVKSGAVYILLEARLVQLYPQIGGKKWKKADNETLFKILGKFKGKDLVGAKYEPLFDYFAAGYGERAFRVISDGYVTADGGTGIVHQAPAFGEDDYRVCLKHGIIDKGKDVPCPVDANGCYTAEVGDFKGQHVKEADAAICDKLKEMGRLVNKAKYAHSYPFCWRSDTPLIYKAVPSWFVAVEQIKDRLLKNNEGTYWVPNFVKEGRFHNWLADARDWAVSRNRFWGTPIPIWASEDYKEIVAIGSVEELETLAGLPKGSVTDLHRESIDGIAIPSKTPGAAPLKRVDEVFDCWFESGSMPYAQLHYPFENKERFEKGFPAHFIAEGLDQTRGWFYTLMVLSTALFDKPAFTNLIVNGMVLASDGKKMSKRLKNYPDPNDVISAYGADALRMYLINSPVVRAEPLKFKEDGVKGVLRDVMIPWYNAFRFMVQNAARWQEGDPQRRWQPSADLAAKSSNPVDVWIQAELGALVAFVHEEMGAYRLYTVMPRLVAFLDQLTKWFVRLNRERLKGTDGDAEALVGLSVLYQVLLTATSIMSPFTPYFAEVLYLKLRKFHPACEAQGGQGGQGGDPEALGSAKSVHFLQLPRNPPEKADFAATAALVSAEMSALQTVVELGRKAREARNISLKKPVKEIVVVTSTPAQFSGLTKLAGYLKLELTAVGLDVTDKEDKWCKYSAKPNFGALGKRVGKDMPAVKAAVTALTNEQLALFRHTGAPLEVCGGKYKLGKEDLEVVRNFAGDTDRYAHVESEDGSMVVAVDCAEDPDTLNQWLGREITSAVQKLRKAAKLQVGDAVEVFFSEPESNGGVFARALRAPEVAEGVKAKIGMLPLPLDELPQWTKSLAASQVEVAEWKLDLAIASPNTGVKVGQIQKDYPQLDDKTLKGAAQLVGQVAGANKALTVSVDGHVLKLAKGKHFFASVAEALA